MSFEPPQKPAAPQDSLVQQQQGYQGDQPRAYTSDQPQSYQGGQPQNYQGGPHPEYHNDDPNYGMPAPQVATRRGTNFLNGICVCCADCDSCVESWCCVRCQMSRQCNMIKNGDPEIDWLLCGGALLLDYLLTAGCAGKIFVCQAREMVRRRYGIAGTCCNDCCCACWCTCCIVQQQLLEMTYRGDFPGACCYEAPLVPSPMHMQ